jgi:hypothetical protein
MALHEQCVGATNEWYTPPHVFEALGCSFDMDVASPGEIHVPWIPTDTHFTHEGLERQWNGFVWMNPPFGGRNGIVPWLDKFFAHGNGIALTPDRTSAPWWRRYATMAHKVLFVSPKLKFIAIDRRPGRSPAQGTSLMAIGSRGVAALHRAADKGLGVLMAVQPSAVALYDTTSPNTARRSIGEEPAESALAAGTSSSPQCTYPSCDCPEFPQRGPCDRLAALSSPHSTTGEK